MKGKCTNVDYNGDNNCPQFDKIVDIPDGEDFRCGTCGQELVKVTDHGSGWSKWLKKHKLFLAVIVIILVIGGVVIWLLSGTGKNDKNPDREITVPPQDSTSVMTDSLSMQTKPESSVTESTGKEPLVETKTPDDSDKGGLDIGIKEPVTHVGSEIIVVHDTIHKTDTIEKEKIIVTSVAPTKTYPFGIYQGGMKNGYPEGDGKMTYTRRVQIAKHDRDQNLQPVVRFAEAGDYFVGSWGNGDIVSGTLYDCNGNMKEKIFTSKRYNLYDISND